MNPLGRDSFCICLKSDPACLVSDFLVWLSLGFHGSPSALAPQWDPVKMYSSSCVRSTLPFGLNKDAALSSWCQVTGLKINFQWHPGKLHKPSVHSHSLTCVLRRCRLIRTASKLRNVQNPWSADHNPSQPNKGPGQSRCLRAVSVLGVGDKHEAPPPDDTRCTCISTAPVAPTLSVPHARRHRTHRQEPWHTPVLS